MEKNTERKLMTKLIKKTPLAEVSSTQTTMSTEIIPQEEPKVNQIDSWIEMRKNFSAKVVSIMVEGKDYHKLNFRGKEVQVLAKGGAEKVASALGWTAEFVKDTETFEMLGSPMGTLCYICKLQNGKFVGEGRGARSVKQDGGDINKTIKMAQKSAFIDAILRASGLSDLFTQDLEQEEQKVTQGENLTTKLNRMQPSEDDKVVNLYTRDLEACTTMQEWELVCSNIKTGVDNGKVSDWAKKVLQKTAAVIRDQLATDQIASKIPFESKPVSSAAKIMSEARENAIKKMKE